MKQLVIAILMMVAMVAGAGGVTHGSYALPVRIKAASVTNKKVLEGFRRYYKAKYPKRDMKELAVQAAFSLTLPGGSQVIVAAPQLPSYESLYEYLKKHFPKDYPFNTIYDHGFFLYSPTSGRITKIASFEDPVDPVGELPQDMWNLWSWRKYSVFLRLGPKGQRLTCVVFGYPVSHGNGKYDCDDNIDYIMELVFDGDRFVGASGPFVIGGASIWGCHSPRGCGTWLVVADKFWPSFDGVDPNLKSPPGWVVIPRILSSRRTAKGLPDIVIWQRHFESIKTKEYRKPPDDYAFPPGWPPKYSLVRLASERLLIQHFDTVKKTYSAPQPINGASLPASKLWDAAPGVTNCDYRVYQNGGQE